MNPLLLFLCILLLPDSQAAESPPKMSPEKSEASAITDSLREFMRQRPAMFALASDDPARVRHVAGLQALYKRAQASRGSGLSLEIAVYTELHRFGVTIPNAIRLCINDDETVPTQVLAHPQTHVLYVLESDGRHISALTPEGKILWHRNPFEDAGLLPYRFTKPVIRYFAFMKDNPQKIGIGFNSSQGGILDVATGDFTWQGQD